VTLPDAKIPVPVFPGAKLVDTSYADTGEGFVANLRTVMWTMSSPKPLDEIVAFYKSQWPDAEEGHTEDNVAFLKYIPPSAPAGTKATVFFYSNNKIFIEQDTPK